MVQPDRIIRPRAFPPRAFRRHHEQIQLADVFGDGGVQPGPSPVTGGQTTPIDPAQVAYENPRLIGFVLKQSSTCWLAFRTQKWGGTQAVDGKFDKVRDFIQAACGGQFLRQVRTRLQDGTEAIQFWNDTIPIPVPPPPVSDYYHFDSPRVALADEFLVTEGWVAENDGATEYASVKRIDMVAAGEKVAEIAVASATVGVTDLACNETYVLAALGSTGLIAVIDKATNTTVGYAAVTAGSVLSVAIPSGAPSFYALTSDTIYVFVVAQCIGSAGAAPVYSKTGAAYHDFTCIRIDNGTGRIMVSGTSAAAAALVRLDAGDLSVVVSSVDDGTTYGSNYLALYNGDAYMCTEGMAGAPPSAEFKVRQYTTVDCAQAAESVALVLDDEANFAPAGIAFDLSGKGYVSSASSLEVAVFDAATLVQEASLLVPGVGQGGLGQVMSAEGNTIVTCYDAVGSVPGLYLTTDGTTIDAIENPPA